MKNLEEPLVSIILSNYNGLNHLKECFDSLMELSYKNVEIIFIDNNSQDKSVEFVKNYYPSVKIIKNEKDYGFAGANNIAASKANGIFLAFLNVDTVVDKNWLIELVKIAENEKDAGIVVSKHYYYDNKEIINYAGGSSDKYGKTSHIGINFKDHRIFNIKRETFFACFAGVLINRELYKKIGLFDSLYYAYCEDYDLSWRAWLAGFRVIYAPKSFIFHKVGQILGDPSPKRFFLNERNKLRTLLKNYEMKTIVKIIPIYIGKRIGMILKDIIKLNKNAFMRIYVYFKAFLWNFLHIHSLIRNRKFIYYIRRKDDYFIFQIMDNSKRLKDVIEYKE